MHCLVTNCKMSVLNKPPGVTFHSCPGMHQMRIKWLQILKNRYSTLDWSKSKICSKHFENKYFDSQRRLRENAVPTLFNVTPGSKATNTSLVARTKVGRLLNKMTQAGLSIDIKNSFNKLREPSNLDMFVTDDLKCMNDAPVEAHLWLLLKKQQYLNARLTEQLSQSKKHVDILQKSLEDTKVAKKDVEQNIDSLKYIVKCLQEKHATLEEQIEILTAVESR